MQNPDPCSRPPGRHIHNWCPRIGLRIVHLHTGQAVSAISVIAAHCVDQTVENAYPHTGTTGAHRGDGAPRGARGRGGGSSRRWG